MSKYTTTVRNICESIANDNERGGFLTTNEIIQRAAPVIFDFDYPIFDDDYKLPLETKILRHYYMREIGMETFGLWQLRLQDKLEMIMPYYNQLYLSGLNGRDPFDDTDYTVKKDNTQDRDSQRNGTEVGRGDKKVVEDETGHANENGHSATTDSENGESNSVGWNLYQDTPQNGLTDVESMEYLTNANKTTNDTETESHGQSDTYTDNNTDTKRDKTTTTDYTDNKETEDKAKILTVDDYLEHVYGKRSYTSYAELLLIYRQTFLNIDQMIVDECSDLFFGLW